MPVHTNLCADLHGLAEGLSPGGQDHELLEGKTVAGVLAAVDHVERGHRHLELVVTRKLCEMLQAGSNSTGEQGTARFTTKKVRDKKMTGGVLKQNSLTL